MEIKQSLRAQRGDTPGDCDQWEVSQSKDK